MAALPVECRCHRDPGEPGAELRFPTVLPEPPKGAEPRILRPILRLRIVTRQSPHDGENPAGMPLVEPSDCVGISCTRPLDQIVVHETFDGA
jgi:hypothetical protein